MNRTASETRKQAPRGSKMTPKGTKRPQKSPKTTPSGVQEGQKSDPKRQDEKRTEPRRSQDRLGPPRGRLAPTSPVQACPFGRPKRHPNRSQNDQNSKRKIKRKKNRSKTILDPSWGDLGPSWAASWGKKRPKTWENVGPREHSLFRR